MRRTGWKVLLVASLCLNVGFVSSLVIHKVHHRRDRGPAALKLPPQVQAQVDANDASFRERLAALHAELHDERAKLVALVAAGDPSPEAIRAQQERVLAANDRIVTAFTEHLLNQKRLLTPQEQRLFFEHIQSHRPREERRGATPKEEKRP